MNAETPKVERVVRLLLETFPEHPHSDGSPSPLEPGQRQEPESPRLSALVRDLTQHGIRELSSPLSE